MAAINFDFDRNSFSQFRSDERILNSKEVTFVKKIEALIHIWEIISELHIFECNLEELIQILEWAKYHALNILLEAEWNQFSISYHLYLKRNIQTSQVHLAKVSTGFILPCEKLLDVMKNPWENPVLLKILNMGETFTEDEVGNFFHNETAYLTSVRLMKLCECGCEDMALNLAIAFIDSFNRYCGTDKKIKATHDQVWFIFDVFIALLYKYGFRQKIFQMLSGLTLENGLILVKRFATKIKKMELWNRSFEIAKYASQIYISKIAFQFLSELGPVFEEFIKFYYNLCMKDCSLPEFIIAIRRISNITNRDGIHKLCGALHNIKDLSLKNFLIEIYIKVITTDINECEMCKVSNETKRVELITSELAEIFCKLSMLLDDNINVARECVLTGFSLEPTESRLKMIETFAERSGMPIEPRLNWKCSVHPPVLKTDELMWTCSECGDWMTKPQLTRPIENNVQLHKIFCSDLLGIPQTICDDLSVCISYSRYQILSWYQPWTELLRFCVMYLKDPVSTKNFITDLKYVDIDYSLYRNIKKEPTDEIFEIEKDYLWLGDEMNIEKSVSSPSTSASVLKDFIIKLKPLHITADCFSPTVIVQRD